MSDGAAVLTGAQMRAGARLIADDLPDALPAAIAARL